MNGIPEYTRRRIKKLAADENEQKSPVVALEPAGGIIPHPEEKKDAGAALAVIRATFANPHIIQAEINGKMERVRVRPARYVRGQLLAVKKDGGRWVARGVAR